MLLVDPMSPIVPQRLDAATLPAALLLTAARRGAAPFLRVIDPRAPERPPRVLSFAAFAQGVRRGVALLERAGVGPGHRILIVAENSAEWQMVALAAQSLRAEPAALFASLDGSAVRDIARRVSPRVVLASGPAQWAKLAPDGPELAAAGLRMVASLDPLDPAAVPGGVERVDAAGALADGPEVAPERFAALAAAVQPEDPFLLLFTSGTTGRMKGVRLPQRAMLRALEAGAASTAITAADEGLHFLPFGHVAGHDQFMLALATGHALILASRREDIERGLALHPTYLFSVPLVYERIAEAVRARARVAPWPLGGLLRASLAAAQRCRVDGAPRRGDRALARVCDLLVGRAVRRRLGGRVRGLFAGGAAVAPPLFAFFESLRIPFVELYGMTETAGMIASNLFHGTRQAGCAGTPTADLELRIEADGELSVRGATLFTGYLDAEDDAAGRSPEGYFRTGDRARLGPDGQLFVEGRKKDLLVLSTGKKLAPEPIERALTAAPPFLAAMLLGEGRPFVAAVVFVPEEELRRLSALGRAPEVALLEAARARLEGFSEHEKPKRILVVPGAPQDHPGLLTPTLKLKRAALLEQLRREVEQLYAAPRSR